MATVDRSAFFLERSEIFLMVIAMCESSKFGEQRRVGGFLAILERKMR